MSRATVQRAVKKLRDRGEASFHEPRRGRGISVFTGETADAANRLLAEGMSAAALAREPGIARSTVYYNLGNGFVGAEGRPQSEAAKVDEATRCPDDLLGRGERDRRDRVAPKGRARQRRARRGLDGGHDRSAAALRPAALGGRRGGVLAALLKEGLPEHANRFLWLPKGYYGLTGVLLMLAFLFMGRNPEALRHEAPGERGAVVGLDRCPEARTLQRKIRALASDPQRIRDWQDALAWIADARRCRWTGT